MSKASPSPSSEVRRFWRGSQDNPVLSLLVPDLAIRASCQGVWTDREPGRYFLTRPSSCDILHTIVCEEGRN